MHSTLSLSLISPKEVLTSWQCIQIHLGYLGFVVLICLDFVSVPTWPGRQKQCFFESDGRNPVGQASCMVWQLQHLERLDKGADIWSSKTHIGLLSTRITGGLKFIYFLLSIWKLAGAEHMPRCCWFWMMSAMLWKASLYAVAWLYFLQRAGTFSYMLHSLWSLPIWDPSTGNPYFMVQTVSQSVSVLPISGGNSSPLRVNKTWDPKHPKAKLLRKKSGQHFQDPDPIIFPMPHFICQYLHFLQTPYACWVLGKTSRFRGNPNWSKRPVCGDWGVHNVVLWPFKLNLHAFKT